MADLQDGAAKLKQRFEENFAKAKDIVDNFRNIDIDLTTENPE